MAIAHDVKKWTHQMLLNTAFYWTKCNDGRSYVNGIFYKLPENVGCCIYSDISWLTIVIL